MTSSGSVGDEPTERAAFILTGAAILFVFHYHLVGALVAGLLTHTILHRGTRFLRGSRLSHGAAKFLAAGLLGVAGATVAAGAVVLAVGFLRGRIGDLPALFRRLADVLDQFRMQLQSLGVSSPWLGQVDDGTLHQALTDWLRSHASTLTRVGREAGVFLLHALLGILLGLILFFRRPAPAPARPLAAALGNKVRRLAGAFDSVVVAQVEVSTLNTLLTGVYLFLVLPLFGAPLPLSGTLLVLTFLTGLIPIVGNVISVAAIVAVALGASLKVAALSLAFFLVLHKLLYFVNARIVGSRVGAGAWEILLAMIALEAAFGMPGLVLAPILYAYLKRELADRGLV